MSGIWLVSYIALWLLVIILALVVLSLARLVGQLHRRLGPAGALVTDHGPAIGEHLGEVIGRAGLEAEGALRFPQADDSLLVFVSPTCSACVDLLWDLRAFISRHRDLGVMVISGTPVADRNAAFAKAAEAAGAPLRVLPALTEAARIGPTPFAVWLDSVGVVRAKGIVNQIEHLDSLLHARQSGFASLDEAVEASERVSQPPTSVRSAS